MDFYVSQGLGIIALIFSCISYFVKSKHLLLLLNTISNVFFASSYVCLGVLTAGTISFVSTIRSLYLYFSEKFKFKYTFCILPIFFALYITLGIVFWKSPLDIIPIITSSLITIALYLKGDILLRLILLIPNFMLVVFGILTMAYSNACLNLISAIVLIIAIIKFYITKRKLITN